MHAAGREGIWEPFPPPVKSQRAKELAGRLLCPNQLAAAAEAANPSPASGAANGATQATAPAPVVPAGTAPTVASATTPATAAAAAPLPCSAAAAHDAIKR